MIKIDFTIEQNGETFCDALYLEDDHTFTDEEIEAMKQNRFDKFYANVAAVSAQEIFAEEIPQE
tara:strand:+ start:151 stop:342 length:192 start_codon:yes stop_codon:yes gene_type:complete